MKMLQNATAEETSYSLSGFYSDMPHTCNITKWTIESVKDEDGAEVSGWDDFFAIDDIGNFTVTTDTVINSYMVYVSVATANVQSAAVHAVNVTVAEYIEVNPNIAPAFEGISGKRLGPVRLFTDSNYHDSEFKLPAIADPDGDNTWVWLEEGRFKTVTYYDNTTRSFKFYDYNITEAMVGTYRVDIQIGDDHWLGPLTADYTLEFIVEIPNKPIIVKAPVDTSFIGAKVADLGTSGAQAIDFAEPVFVNPAFVSAQKARRRRRLQEEKAQLGAYEASNATNTTWVEYEAPPPAVEIPDDMDDLVFDASLIDDSVFEIHVDPSPYQDASKMRLDWVVESLDANGIKF